MAKSLSSKSKDPLKIVLYVVAGLFIFFVAVLLFTREQDWEDYLADLSDNETYFVYLYSDNCDACAKITDEVADFTQSNTMNIELIPLDANNRVVPDDYYTPTILVVHNNEIAQTVVGMDHVLDLFDEVEAGTFQP